MQIAKIVANFIIIYKMLIFQREIENKIRERLFRGRAILLFGPRQAGKTTLAKKVLSEYGEDGAYFNCELAAVRKAFVPGKPELLAILASGRRIIVFDEAQTIQDIGLTLKTFVDTYPDIQVIATGSSSFDLANKIQEPLTGRAFEFTLFPLSLKEIRTAIPDISQNDLFEFIRLGTYPSVVGERDTKTKEDILKNLATNYLYKDVYMFESIRNPRIFEDMVGALALQTGSLVSVNELSQTIGASRLSVEKYLRLLEQSYVIKIVRAFSRNPRTEIKKAFKVFFLDTGVRNAVVDNMSGTETRNDRGPLWENFVMGEHFKRSAYEGGSKIYFWRSRQGDEIDIVEEKSGDIAAFECKWSDTGNTRPPAQFAKAYPQASFEILTPKSYLLL